MNRIIQNVRQESNAGWYIGSVYVYEDNIVSEDRDTFYYKSEDILIKFYPYSISLEQAYEKAKMRNWINR